MRGIEPPCAAWEAAVLPLNYTREEISDFRFSIADCNRNKLPVPSAAYPERYSVCCILAILAFFGPRLALFLAWVFTPTYLSRAFDTFLIPFLGFVFLPWTTIAYAIAQNELGGLNGIGLLVVILGVLADVGVLGGGARQRRG